MPRRNLIPLLLLAVLGFGALGFAVLGASSAPSGATLTVQSSSVRTFGTPTGSSSKLFAVLNPSAIACSLSTYTAIVGGDTPWTGTGTAFVRTESLATYDARVPAPTSTACVPRPTSVQGTVHERAAVHAGYLVGVRLTVVVPPQTLANGQHAPNGVENQALVLLEINGTRSAALSSS